MADWNGFSKKNFLGNLYKGQNLKVRKFQIHSTLESKVIKRKPTGGGHKVPPPPVLIGLRKHFFFFFFFFLYIQNTNLQKLKGQYKTQYITVEQPTGEGLHTN